MPELTKKFFKGYLEQFVGKYRCTKIQSTTLKNTISDLYNLSVNRHMLRGG